LTTTRTSPETNAFSPGTEVRDETDGAVYRVVRSLGRGGMGEVHEVVRVDTGASYALKCMLLQHASKPKAVERARREGVALLALRHPNVVRVHATGVREDGLIWMVMDLLSGHTLALAKHRLGRLPLPWALGIGRAVADGLAAVHGVAVHRDVKPDNIHLGHDGVVRVLDLGAGKFHHSGLLTTGNRTLGTVPYMSPEQLAAGASVDHRSDIFSLGTVLAELISGAHPFAPKGLGTENVFTMVSRIVKDAPLPLRTLAPWVPEYVGATVDRALARDREQRWPSASAFAEALAGDRARLEREVGPAEPLATLVRELRAGDEGPVESAPTVEQPGHPGVMPTMDDEALRRPR
jgi:serine/threonine-protein kinase